MPQFLSNEALIDRYNLSKFYKGWFWEPGAMLVFWSEEMIVTWDFL